MRLGSKRFHLVGVGGSGMSGLARLLHGIGAEVTGSDAYGPIIVETLREEGLSVWSGSHPTRIEGEDGYVVRSAAVPASDPEMLEAERRGFRPLLYAEAVGRLSEGKRTVAISGTHGKTTTTALTVAALRGGGLDPSHLVGGDSEQLGGNGYGGRGHEFVVEACEFNRSFHSIRPYAAAILNLDHDHFDCYQSTEELEEAFAAYLAGVRPGGSVLVHEDVPVSVLEKVDADVTILRVGSGLFADIRAVEITDDCGRYGFTPMLHGERLPRIQLQLPGRFQVYNALFAFGLSQLVGADAAGACSGLTGFTGVRRRFELREGRQGTTLVNDYAHHPAEIEVVLRAAKRRYPGRRLVVVFQPHQHQRTLHLLEGFADALSLADHSVIADIYGARESAELKRAVSAADLVSAIHDRGGSSECGGAVQALPGLMEAVPTSTDDLVLVLGAGDIDDVVQEICDVL